MMKNLSKHTRAMLKRFDQYIQTHRVILAISKADDDWKHRHCAIEETLKQCQTATIGILHAYNPVFQLSAFVTFPASQGTATTDQIIQALRIALIARSEAEALV